MKDKKIFKISGIAAILLGILAIILGNNVSYYVSYENTKTYGGDAYTGIQNASAQTANNINNLGQAYIESYSFFMDFIGITMIVGGIIFIVYSNSNTNELKNENTYETETKESE